MHEVCEDRNHVFVIPGPEAKLWIGQDKLEHNLFEVLLGDAFRPDPRVQRSNLPPQKLNLPGVNRLRVKTEAEGKLGLKSTQE